MVLLTGLAWNIAWWKNAGFLYGGNVTLSVLISGMHHPVDEVFQRNYPVFLTSGNHESIFWNINICCFSRILISIVAEQHDILVIGFIEAKDLLYVEHLNI